MARNFTELIAWQRAMKLTKAIYNASAHFPSDEKYALLQQIRRAAVSVPSNIAEGQARHSSKEFLRFLSNARGSLAEVQTHIMLAEEFGYIPNSEAKKLFTDASELYRIINGLYSSILDKVEAEKQLSTNH